MPVTVSGTISVCMGAGTGHCVCRLSPIFIMRVRRIKEIGLKPEESEAFEVGLKYNTYFLRAHIAGFYRKGKNMIDWVKEKPEDIWESQNLTKVDNLGFETNLSLLPRELGNERFFIRKIELGYAFIHQDKDSEGYISNYALDYLKHKVHGSIKPFYLERFSATWYVRWQDRAGSYTKYENLKPAYEEPYAPYCLVDMKVNWEYQRLNLYAELNNLLNSTYYDLGNIPQPGIWFKAGFRYSFKYYSSCRDGACPVSTTAILFLLFDHQQLIIIGSRTKRFP